MRASAPLVVPPVEATGVGDLPSWAVGESLLSNGESTNQESLRLKEMLGFPKPQPNL